ncbi:MAG: hypothetical protein VX694_05815 [Planctomycetota bacterium]|nr:hypothetical protein [Planctomycetota bacterium]
MDLLRQSTGQARQALDSMPPLSRAVLAAMLLLVLASGSFLYRSAGDSSHEMLFGGRSLVDHELDAIELAFSRAGLDAWQRSGRQIQIPKEKRSEYLAALSDTSALPFTLRNPMKEAMQASNLFDSTSMRNSREMLAKEQDLGIKIAAFPDVQWASVDYDEGEKRGLSSPKQQSASILVIPQTDSPLSHNRIKSIQELVRGSFAGLNAQDIVVIDTNANPDDGVFNEDPAFRKQKEVETRIEQKVRNLLADFPAKIAVSAQIDDASDKQRALLKIRSDTVNLLTPKTLLDVLDNKHPVSTSKRDSASVIGNRSVVITSSFDDLVREAADTSGKANQNNDYSEFKSLRIKSVRVSVGLPTSYYQQLHTQEFRKNKPGKVGEEVPGMTDQDLADLRGKTEDVIRSAVTVLLPEAKSALTDTPLVEVWDYADFSGVGVTSTNQAESIFGWMINSKNHLLYLALSFLTLLAVVGYSKFSSQRKLLSHEDEAAAESLRLHEMTKRHGELYRPTDHASKLERQLTASFESDPELGAKVIQNWIRQAG